MRRLVKVSLAALLIGVPGTAQSDEISELKDRMEQLQQENAGLHQELDQQEHATQSLLDKIKSLETKDERLSYEVQRVAEATTVTPEDIEAEEPMPLPKMTIKVFGDLPFEYRFKSDGEVHAQFTQGDHDFFFLGALSEKLSVLVENDFHFHTDGTGVVHSHLERAELRYTLSDHLKITAGLQHTPLGYWNQTYHHGSWLQTTIERPDMYEFHRPNVQQGSILPEHALGVTLTGVFPFEVADLEYATGLYNGREKIRNISPGFNDENDFKAVNLLLSVIPHAIDGLKAGINTYIDKIPGERAIAGNLRQEDIDEFIIGWYTTYFRENLELITEWHWIDHDDLTTEKTFKTVGGYVQGSYRVDKVTPYYRLDMVDLGQGDPYYFDYNPATFAVRGRDTILDHFKHTWGVRWDILPWNALKFEYTLVDNHGQDQDDEHVLAFNTSYVF